MLRRVSYNGIRQIAPRNDGGNYFGKREIHILFALLARRLSEILDVDALGAVREMIWRLAVDGGDEESGLISVGIFFPSCHN